MVTSGGEEFFVGFGIEVRERGRSRRPFCRPCLDWSARRTHLAGAVGAALAARCFELGWITRRRDTRALLISDNGKCGVAETCSGSSRRPEPCARPAEFGPGPVGFLGGEGGG